MIAAGAMVAASASAGTAAGLSSFLLYCSAAATNNASFAEPGFDGSSLQ